MLINLTVNDLYYIYEAAKALKQNNFVFIVYNPLTIPKVALVGLDNIDTCSRIMYLDNSKLSANLIDRYAAIQFNQKELSKFIKSITTETFYTFEGNSILRTNTDVSMAVFSNEQLYNTASAIINHTNNIDINMQDKLDIDITDEIASLFDLRIDGGAIHQIINGRLITMFNGILPLSKNDRILFNTVDESPKVFTARFTVVKKKYSVMVYLSYLNVLG